MVFKSFLFEIDRFKYKLIWLNMIALREKDWSSLSKEQFIRTVRKNGASLAINLPKEIVELLNIKDKDLARIEIEKVEKKKGEKN